MYRPPPQSSLSSWIDRLAESPCLKSPSSRDYGVFDRINDDDGDDFDCIFAPDAHLPLSIDSDLWPPTES